jgi:hypothetical protein
VIAEWNYAAGGAIDRIRVGLLLNFNAPRLIDGLRRYVV